MLAVVIKLTPVLTTVIPFYFAKGNAHFLA